MSSKQQQRFHGAVLVVRNPLCHALDCVAAVERCNDKHGGWWETPHTSARGRCPAIAWELKRGANNNHTP